jgi:hypothetical protein
MATVTCGRETLVNRRSRRCADWHENASVHNADIDMHRPAVAVDNSAAILAGTAN